MALEGYFMRGLTFSLITASAIAGLATLATAQPQQAGVSAAVRGQVALARASQNIVGKQVQSGDPIFLGDAITSGKASGLQVMLLDETVFTIGPNSEISIDEFVYDPSTNAGKITASVAKGAFRFITGKIARKRPEDMTVRLPTATIGIRGTIVAGVVRGKPGADPAADAVFSQLTKDAPSAEDARDFVILLGPGNENNTNDRGGEFVFTANPPERAMRGLSAGQQQPPQAPGGISGFAPPPSITISRTENGALGFENRGPVGPFPVTNPAVIVNTVIPTNTQGSRPADDTQAQEANSTSPDQAPNLSGDTIADTVQIATDQSNIEVKIEETETAKEEADAAANGGVDFSALTAITSGSAFASNPISNLGPFLISNSFFQINFGNTTFQFDMQISSGGGLSSAQIGCFSSCAINYGGLSGPAVFDSGLIGSQANLTRVNCNNCNVDIAVTSAVGPGDASINVTLEHAGNTGSAAVQLNQ
jgi:hypothetical protein